MSDMQSGVAAGEALFAAGRNEDARRWFLDYLNEHPRHPEVLNNLGVICYSGNEYKEAEQYFLLAVGARENFTVAILNLANLYQSAKQWEKAAEYLERAIRIGGQPRQVHDRLCFLYKKIGDREKDRESDIRCSGTHGSSPDGRVSDRIDGSASSSVHAPQTPSPILALTRQALGKVLTRTCYFPHPEVHRGELILSKDVFKGSDRETNLMISPAARLDLTGNITIGSWTMVGEGTTILTHDHYHGGREKPLLLLQEERGVKWRSKNIGRDVWLHGCTVLYQVTEIPDGVVVGAGAVLTQNPGPYEIWAGNPARKVGQR
jgi:hypothetical protein